MSLSTMIEVCKPFNEVVALPMLVVGTQLGTVTKKLEQPVSSSLEVWSILAGAIFCGALYAGLFAYLVTAIKEYYEYSIVAAIGDWCLPVLGTGFLVFGVMLLVVRGMVDIPFVDFWIVFAFVWGRYLQKLFVPSR